MTTATRYDAIIVRNRHHRTRDVGFGCALVALIALALGAIGSADHAQAATRDAGAARACLVTDAAC
ncbi:MAG: hypothetical protein R3B06_11485 [Kofleriaceae bacterium]